VRELKEVEVVDLKMKMEERKKLSIDAGTYIH
jgi:hypothetical protein